MSISPSPIRAEPPERIRTTRRRGRMTDQGRSDLIELGADWAITAETLASQHATSDAFGIDQPLALDIGVGSGEATITWARNQPGLNIAAIELHRPTMVQLLRALDNNGPPNVRLIEADATAVVRDMAAGSVETIRLLFPDPWPKRRHVERRMVNSQFLNDVANSLRTGGRLEIATDWLDYAKQVRQLVASHDCFEAGDSSTAEPRPTTAYETRGVKAGRTITDLVFIRR